MRLKKEKVKSLIIGADRSFRSQTVRMLNDIAYPAEKFQASTSSEALNMYHSDSAIENIIAAGNEYPGQNIQGFLQGILPKIKEAKREFIFLVYLAEEHGDIIDSLRKEYPEVHFRILPHRKSDYIEVFHPKRETQSLFAKPKPPAPKQEAQQKSNSTLTFFEASGHVRETIDLINQIGKNRGDIEAFINIGQRFNGLIGTFSFVKDKDGYKHLLITSTIIDDVCRTYESGELDQVKDDHFDLVLRAAKNAFSILKNMREEKGLETEQKTENDLIHEIYQQMNDIRKREHRSQDEVDAILDSLDKVD